MQPAPAVAQGIPVVQRGPIITLRFAGPPPPPHPPCLDPTPEEEYARSEAIRQQQLQQKELERQQQVQQTEKSGGGGAFFKVAKLAGAVAHVVEKAAGDVHAKGEASVRELAHSKNQQRFVENFPELAQSGDQLITDYTCRVMSQGQQFSGHLQVTTRNLCFCSESLREIIPLQEIASIQKSIALETLDNGPPFIMPIPAPNVLPDTLQVFTVRQQIFQFMHFESTIAKVGQVMTSTIKGRPVDRAYNFLDHAWRASVQVPLPGLQYAAY